MIINYLGGRVENEASLACMYQAWDNRITAGPDVGLVTLKKNNIMWLNDNMWLVEHTDVRLLARWKKVKETKRNKKAIEQIVKTAELSTAAWQDGQ